MLEVTNLSAAYGQHPSLNDISIKVKTGEVVVILGANGAGKSTLLRAISGICEGKVSGDVTLNGESLTGLSSDAIVEKGVALVPEGRGIFGDLTVKENLLLGAYSAGARETERENLERVLMQFPKLRERQGQIARTMSGGEQQMLTMCRTLIGDPEFIMIDEPTEGLSPQMTQRVAELLKEIARRGVATLLVEQKLSIAMDIANRVYVMGHGQVVFEGTPAELKEREDVRKEWLEV